MADFDSPDTIERHAARVLLVDPGGATLLVRGQDPADLARGPFYWTPGGGIDDGETADECARREVLEEVGYDIGAADDGLGRLVARRSSTFPFDGKLVTQHEVFFFVSTQERFQAAPLALSDLEHRAIVSFDWLTPSDMRSSKAQVYPVGLPDLVEDVQAHGRPRVPVILH